MALFTILTVDRSHCLPFSLFTVLTVYRWHCLPFSPFTVLIVYHSHLLPFSLLTVLTVYRSHCYRSHCLPLSLFIVHTVFYSNCLQLKMITVLTVYHSHCLPFSLFTVENDYRSHCLPFTQLTPARSVYCPNLRTLVTSSSLASLAAVVSISSFLLTLESKAIRGFKWATVFNITFCYWCEQVTVIRATATTVSLTTTTETWSQLSWPRDTERNKQVNVLCGKIVISKIILWHIHCILESCFIKYAFKT